METLEPRWTKYLAPCIRPTARQVEQLEALRAGAGVDERTFGILVRHSPASLRRVCEATLDKLRGYFPDSSPRDLLNLTFVALLLNARSAPAGEFELSPDSLAKQIGAAQPELGQRLSSRPFAFRNLDELVRGLLGEREFGAYYPGPNRKLQKEIDLVLGWGERDGRPRYGWLAVVPPELELANEAAEELERLRKEKQVPEDKFAMHVLESPGIARLVLRRQYAELEKRKPETSHKERLARIAELRFIASDVAGGLTPETAQRLAEQPWRQARVADLVRRAETLDDLTRLIIEEQEQFWSQTPDPFGINARIAEILGYSRTG